MANQEQLALLRQGVEVWNQWRKENPDVVIDLGHTDLSDADLSGVNFNHANLSGVNLMGAELIAVNLMGAILNNANLMGASLMGASLMGAELRNTNLMGAELITASLVAANLNGASLVAANLSGANLNVAELRNTNLSGANLTAVQVLGTNFHLAKLTGACIEDWHVNSHTNLQEIACEYIFTRYDYEQQQFADRRPHDPTKVFQPGDFAKLVQQSLNTIDLILREGLDWRSFAYSFQQLQVQYADEQIAIQSIENKGDGTVVIKLAVAPNADKGNIEQFFWRDFEMAQRTIAGQYESRLEDKDKYINQLFTLLQKSQEKLGEVPKLMAEHLKAETYNTTVHGNVGNLANKMQDQASQQANQYIGANLNEIAVLIQSLRATAEAFPQEQRTEAIDHLEDLETDLKQPPEKRKQSRMKAALGALMGVATLVNGAVTGVNEFTTQLQELSDKLGIPLPIEQVEPQSPQKNAIDVKAIGSD